MCTRALYVSDDNLVITGRNMDWKEDMATSLYLFPAGIERNGSAGKHSIQWISKYGSVIAAGYDAGSTDGMNEKGLVANLLYLVESDYPLPSSSIPSLSISGITTPAQPNISSTIWRTVSDQSNLVYYFDSATRPNAFWVNFTHLDFSPTATIKKLSLSNGEVYAGEVSANFQRSESFFFIYLIYGALLEKSAYMHFYVIKYTYEYCFGKECTNSYFLHC